MGEPLSLTSPAVFGVNTSEDSITLRRENVGKLIQQTGNLRIENGRWRTDYRVKELTGTVGDDLDLWKSLHTQNAIFYEPQKGQGVHYIGKGVPRIVESAAGRLFTITPDEDTFTVKDVSGGNVAYPNLMLSWLAQGENYVIRTDGKSQTQIWDGLNPVFFSTGYSSQAKDKARFPNFAGPVVYAGGRFWVVLFDRRIYASDSLHQVNQTSAEDLLKFTDQSYDYLNAYFAPPSSEGDIVALGVTINSGINDSRAQGEVFAMCLSPGIWALELGIPREQWAEVKMRRSRSKESAAAGPNAFFVRDGDILMRTARGIESINLLARERNTLGNPAIDLGADIRGILDHDDEQSLLFSSLVNPMRWNTMFCTVSPIIKGARRYHLGWVTGNFNPMQQRVPEGLAWQGIGCLPKKIGRVVQFLTSRADGRSRLFAIVDKDDGASKGLIEFTREEGPHIAADNTTIPQRWYILSRKLNAESIFKTSKWGSIWVKLENIRTNVCVQLYTRTNIKPDWHPGKAFEIRPKPSENDVFQCNLNGEVMLFMGKPFDQSVSWVQILVKGEGVTTIDIAMKADNADSLGETQNQPNVIEMQSPPICQFDPFYPTFVE